MKKFKKKNNLNEFESTFIFSMRLFSELQQINLKKLGKEVIITPFFEIFKDTSSKEWVKLSNTTQILRQYIEYLGAFSIVEQKNIHA